MITVLDAVIPTLLIIGTFVLGQWLLARLFDYIEIRAHLRRDRRKDIEDRPIIDSSEDPDDYVDIYENI